MLWVCGVLKLLSTRHLWNEDQNNLKICGIVDRLTDGQKNKYMPNLVKIQCSENIFYDDDHLPRLQVSMVPCDNTDKRDDEWQSFLYSNIIQKEQAIQKTKDISIESEFTNNNY